MAQDEHLKLTLAAAANKQTKHAAEEPVKERDQHGLKSEPTRPRSPAHPARPGPNFFTPHLPPILPARAPPPRHRYWRPPSTSVSVDVVSIADSPAARPVRARLVAVARIDKSEHLSERRKRWPFDEQGLGNQPGVG
jgi:hypothetical protein